MKAVLEVSQAATGGSISVSVVCHGEDPADIARHHLLIESPELSGALWEGGQLLHAWWRHGLLGLQTFRPIMHDWRGVPQLAVGLAD